MKSEPTVTCIKMCNYAKISIHLPKTGLHNFFFQNSMYVHIGLKHRLLRQFIPDMLNDVLFKQMPLVIYKHLKKFGGGGVVQGKA